LSLLNKPGDEKMRQLPGAFQIKFLPTQPFWGCAILGLSLAMALPAMAQQNASAGIGVTNKIIVKYRHDPAIAPVLAGVQTDSATVTPRPLSASKMNKLQSKLAESTFTVAKESPTSFGARVVNLGRSANLNEVTQLAQKIMASDPEVEYAIPDRFIYLAQMAVPNDPQYPIQWPLYDKLSGIRAVDGWQLFTALPQRRATDANFPLIAIIDSGYRPHVDIPLPYLGLDYVNGTNNPLDSGDSRTAGQCENLPVPQASSWHGLGVDGIISARINNGMGLSGVAGSGAGIFHQRVFGPCGGYLSTYLAAIHDAVDFRSPMGQRVRVINLSQAGPAPCDEPLQAEISRAVAAGVVVVVSAGNSASNVETSSPANCKGTIAVAATDRFGNQAPYSNFGSGITLSAPGGDSNSRTLDDGVLTTSLGLSGTEPTGQQSSDYGFVEGTSFSAPHVSAAAALLLNVNPNLTPDQVKNILTRTARPIPGNCSGGCGAGILDMRKAIELTQVQKMNASLCKMWPRSFSFC
jgi:serine protease